MAFCRFWGYWYQYVIFYSPYIGDLSLLLGQIEASALSITGAQVARIEAHDHMSFGLPDGVDSSCRRICPVSQNDLSCPETVAA
jgi:hypothetical protein